MKKTQTKAEKRDGDVLYTQNITIEIEMKMDKHH